MSLQTFAKGARVAGLCQTSVNGSKARKGEGTCPSQLLRKGGAQKARPVSGISE